MFKEGKDSKGGEKGASKIGLVGGSWEFGKEGKVKAGSEGASG